MNPKIEEKCNRGANPAKQGISYVSTITGSGTYNAIAYQNADNVMAVGMSAVFHYFAANNAAITVTTPVPMQITGDMRTIDVKGTNIVVAGDNGKYFRMTSSGMNTAGEHQNIEWIEMDGIYLSGSDLYRDPTTWESYITAANQINIRSVAIASATQVVFGGNYNAAFYSATGLTNASVQYPYVRTAFDPGDRYSSLFYYDKLGRLVLSQNARQRNSDDRKFSYTLYDELGRVVEVGEKTENSDFVFRDVFGSMVSGHYNPRVIDNAKLDAWINGDGIRQEVTRSYYDVFNTTFYTPPYAVNQDNQRKRISHVAYYSAFPFDDENNPIAFEEYDHATHFVYDIHGNVTKLMQDNRKMATEFETLADHRVKTMEYSYDLISGNVHRMSVQSGESDQWHHAYSYDADNRVVAVHTSTQTPLISIDQPAQFLANELTQNAVNWDLEAKYFYYAHGNLARVELGNQLQGLDYIYNLQGWLKGVNATSLDNAFDPGGDGTGLFSKDVMAFSLHYHDGDYKPIGGISISPINAVENTSHAAANSSDLFNSNIRYIQTTLTNSASHDAMPMLNAYKYDQLQRVIESRSYEHGISSGVWNPTTYNNEYFNAFTYDANGNILTQKRHLRDGTQIEELTYRYHLDVNGNLIDNRLYHVNDTVSAGVSSDDIDDMGTFTSASSYINLNNNYRYDAEGRLVADAQEEIEEIVWRVDGRVKEVHRSNGSNKKHMTFDYDAFGHRIAKHIYNNSWLLEKSVYYVLNAQGMQMAVYEHVATDEDPNYKLTNRHIYGADRIGENVLEVDLFAVNDSLIIDGVLGKKHYELKGHSGSVLTVISDIKIPLSIDSISVSGYRAHILNNYDYSVFGVHLDGRTEINVNYKFGMHGMERDDELKGAGNSYVTTYRLYDPRLGRWFTLDPESSSLCFESNYSFNHNNPNSFVDVDGDFAQMIAGFFIGAATEFTSQYIKNLLKRNPDTGKRFDFGYAWRQTDWGDVMIAGIVGIFLPGLSGNTVAKNIVKVSSKVVMAWVDMGWFRKKATETDRFHIRFFAGKDFFKRTNLDDGEENERLFRGKDMKYLGPEIMNLFIGAGMVGFANGVTSKVTKDDFLKDVLTKPLEGSFKGGAYNIYKPISERIKERCEIRAILKSGKNPIIELSRSKTSDMKTGEHAKDNISTTATGTESSANNSIKIEGQKRNNDQQE